MAALTGEAKAGQDRNLSPESGRRSAFKTNESGAADAAFKRQDAAGGVQRSQRAYGTFIFRAEERYSKADGHWRSCGKPGFFKTLPELGRDCAAPSAISDSKFQSVAAVDGTAQRGSDG